MSDGVSEARGDFRVVQAVYLLLLGLWVGAMVMLVVGAMAAFAFVRGIDGVLLVSLAGWEGEQVHSNAQGFLAGGFVGAMLGRLVVLQLVCAAGLAVCALLHFLWFPRHLVGGRGAKRQGVRLFLLGVPVLVVLFNQFVVTPGIEKWRDPKYNPGTPAELIDKAEDAFDFYHQLSTRTYGVSTLMLVVALGMTPWCFRDPPAKLSTEGERA